MFSFRLRLSGGQGSPRPIIALHRRTDLVYPPFLLDARSTSAPATCSESRCVVSARTLSRLGGVQSCRSCKGATGVHVVWTGFCHPSRASERIKPCLCNLENRVTLHKHKFRQCLWCTNQTNPFSFRTQMHAECESGTCQLGPSVRCRAWAGLTFSQNRKENITKMGTCACVAFDQNRCRCQLLSPRLRFPREHSVHRQNVCFAKQMHGAATKSTAS